MTHPRVVALVALSCLLCLAVGETQARIGVGAGNQEWGYVTVRPRAHMFWWLHYTTDSQVANYTEKPLLIWLQGGPGGSSTGYGNFEELGPLDVQLKYRNYTWVKDYNVLFIDNPVGAGFSYVEVRASGGTSAFAQTNAQIARDLLALMRGFYKQLPEFCRVPVYIVSESYGGKMAVEFALLWHKDQSSGAIVSRLRGVALGDGWLSPIDSMLTWAPYLLQTGMVDADGAAMIEGAAERARLAAVEGRWSSASISYARATQVILNVTRNIDFYNILKRVGGDLGQAAATPEDPTLDSLMNGKVRQALGLNVIWGAQRAAVFGHLYNDFMKPAVSVVERLLNETDLRVFVYNGQLDLVVDTPGTWQWVEKMNWIYSEQWHASSRKPLLADGVIEGYRKSFNNFGFYWINRAGHMVPSDNPTAMALLLEDLTKD